MRLSPDQLAAVPVDRKQLLQAQEVFAEEIGKSFSVDLADLSRDTWSLIPSIGNILVEVRTRKYGTLTYAHDGGDQEDISLFDRARRRNLAIYSSRSKLATRGPFFDEDADAEIDVLDCNVETTFVPERFWMEGRTRLRVRVRTYALSALTLRLAERLVVRSVSSDLHGRLLHIRVRNQNSLVVNLPEPLNRNDVLTLTISYGGRHEPQGVDRENMTVATQVQTSELAFTEAEPHYLYSNRSYWYAQAPQNDYATATIRFTVPAAFGVVCSGEAAGGSPVTLRAAADEATPTPVRVCRDDAAAVSELRGVALRRGRYARRDHRQDDPAAADDQHRAAARTRAGGAGEGRRDDGVLRHAGRRDAVPEPVDRRPREPDPRRPRTGLRGDDQPAPADHAVHVA